MLDLNKPVQHLIVQLEKGYTCEQTVTAWCRNQETTWLTGSGV
jgi:hypothetical protein